MYDLREELLNAVEVRIDRESDDNMLDKLYALRTDILEYTEEELEEIDIDSYLEE